MSSKLPTYAVVIALLAVAGALAWLALEVREQSALLRRCSDHPGARAAAVPAAAAPRVAPNNVKLVDGVPADRRVAYDAFARLWEPALAAKAEARCWKPLTQKFPRTELQPMTHFILTLAADGAVAAAKPDMGELDPEHGPAVVALHRCVAGLIRSMRFPAPGKPVSGRVQANRGSSPSGIR